MTLSAWGQLVVFFGVLLAAAWPLGKYLARVYQGQPCGLDSILGWLEQLLYRLSGVQPQEEMTWRTYAVTLLLFNGIGWLFLYGLLRLQGMLPLNPQQSPPCIRTWPSTRPSVLSPTPTGKIMAVKPP